METSLKKYSLNEMTRDFTFGPENWHDVTFGNLATVFGEPYQTYKDRRVSRLPNGDLLCLHRVSNIQAEWHGFQKKAEIITEVDIPLDAWYLNPEIPFFFFQESALQPCGFLSAYMGSPLLHPEEDYYFRNLDGHITFLKDLKLQGETIETRAVLDKHFEQKDIIIQRFKFEQRCNGEAFSRGEAVFGYFTKSALQTNSGLTAYSGRVPEFKTVESERRFTNFDYRKKQDRQLFPSGKAYDLDQIAICADKNGQDLVFASRKIDENDWYFKNHFYQDPVMPGSLGVETVFQCLKAYCIEKDLLPDDDRGQFLFPTDQMIKWKYRGQVLQTVEKLQVEIQITKIEKKGKTHIVFADGLVWADQTAIYEVKSAAIHIQESDQKMEPEVAKKQNRIAGSSNQQSGNGISPEQLGSQDFKDTYGLKYAYMGGAMANGISSIEMVTELGRSGCLGSFGAAGMGPARLEEAIMTLKSNLPDGNFAINLINSPNESLMEQNAVELFLKHGIRNVEASAYINLSPSLIAYRASGLSSLPDGSVRCENKIIAKLSRTEVASKFMQPAPEKVLRKLVEAGQITEEQLNLARIVPVADDITVEADSGGHTDNRPLVCLLPTMMALQKEIQEKFQYAVPIRVGAGGGISTPLSALSAFMMGADYIVTGSINQGCIEAGISPYVRDQLARAKMTDVLMAPSADMFEMGVRVQVLKTGTLFPMRAHKLYELYSNYGSIDQIPAQEREKIEKSIFQKNLDQVWDDTAAFFSERDPAQIERANKNPKRQMALIFRWYLGLSSKWACEGTENREMDYQIWCGPSMGTFNDWTRGSYLELSENRKVGDVALHILHKAAKHYHQQSMKLQGMTERSNHYSYTPEKPLI